MTGPSQGSPSQRVSLRFAAGARYASFLVERDEGGFVPEHWTLPATAPAQVVRLDKFTPVEPAEAEALPTTDGRLLLLRYGATHRIRVADPGTGDILDQTTATGRALRLVASPNRLALAIGSAGPAASTVYRVLDEPLRLEPAATVPGLLGATGWADLDGRCLVADLRGGARQRPIRIDLDTGAVEDLPAPAGASRRLLLADPAAGLLLVLSAEPGRPALGWARLSDPATVTFPAGLNAIDGTVLPLAIDPAGRQLALRAVRGARSALVIYDLATDTSTEAPLPAGSVFPVAAWAPDGLRVAHTTAGRPTVPRVLVPPRFEAEPDPAPAANLEWFTTPSGRFEAICHGDWRRAEHVLVALHGGPEAAWELRYDRTMSRLAAAGLAIVAPNQRGSTNYGAEHAAAIRGRWGGPDLDDIRHLARAIEAGRGPGAPRPALFGVSYGAYLALLAAAVDPGSWSRCAVIAPFLSGARLWPAAYPPVQAMIDRLGGRTTHTDDLGPRDLHEIGGRITAPLLVIHGRGDEVVPVGHGRELARRLAELGCDIEYVEAPRGGHSPLQHAGGVALIERLVDFLTQPAPAPVG